ncbi:hypothetical protein EVAR_103693_1 [Eumeta japonica]|uniref:Uncharacterized protein n=1 Tax=Eumeta variegata TaxID=151549 RepID=A0A4C1ZZ46_EUMVA|nr:hypothetical protein EVAR_103693_1 [Eumeta japonica]
MQLGPPQVTQGRLGRWTLSPRTDQVGALEPGSVARILRHTELGPFTHRALAFGTLRGRTEVRRNSSECTGSANSLLWRSLPRPFVSAGLGTSSFL